MPFVVKADQSTAENYQASDGIYGELLWGWTFADRNDPAKSRITFNHETIKIKLNLIAGNGVDLSEGIAVQLINLPSFELDNGTTITPYQPDSNKHTYYALVGRGTEIPQNTQFIKVTLGSNTFVYTTPEMIKFRSNRSYTYDITVKAGSIEVTETTSDEWTSTGSENVTSKTVSAKYSAGELKFGDYLYSDGTTSDGGLRKLYADNTMEIQKPKPAPISGKTVVGIVFHAGQHPNDKSDYTQSGIGQKDCPGYAVALQDATTTGCIWGCQKQLDCLAMDTDGNIYDTYDNPDDDWNGYARTQKIISAAQGKNKLNATTPYGYPATYYSVLAYEIGQKAPVNSNGWFLPAIGQMWNISENRASLFDGKEMATNLTSVSYWPSSEYLRAPGLRSLHTKHENHQREHR